MPVALDVDYSQAKLVYASTGSLKAASEHTGISYDAVRQRASREEWQVQVTQAAELVSHRVTEALGNARLSMEERSKRAREGHAEAAVKVADKLSTMDADELFLSAPLLSQHAKHAQTVFGWASVVTGSVRLDVLASGAGDQEPVIDV